MFELVDYLCLLFFLFFKLLFAFAFVFAALLRHTFGVRVFASVLFACVYVYVWFLLSLICLAV